MLDEITHIRTEIKFALGDLEADRLAEELAAHLEPVRRAWVTTVYLDRPDGGLSAAARSSPHLNVKVRLRDYAEPGSLWLELKRRAYKTSEKVRARLPRRALGPFLDGRDVSSEVDDPGAYRDIRAILPGPAEPVGAVHFFRRSFESREPRVRVTLDRDVSYHLVTFLAGEEPLDVRGLGLPIARDEGATLEVKYGAAAPTWLASITGGLDPAGRSKFLTLLGHVDRF
jgi:hypothetical protein